MPGLIGTERTKRTREPQRRAAALGHPVEHLVGHRACWRAYIAGNGKHSMTSTESTGKIMKCGCPTKSFAADSWDSASTTTNPVMLFFTFSIPCGDIRLVLPSGAPLSTMAA